MVLDTTLVGILIVLLAELDNRIEQIKNRYPRSDDAL
jgi:hypothetical protein